MEQEVVLASEAWINAGGMILIAIGISLLVLEFFIPSYGLFGFAGASCVVIGIIQLHQTGYIEDFPVSIRTLSTMAGVGVVLAGFGARYTYKLYRKKNTTGVEAMIGANAYVIHWRGKKGRVRIQGEDWQAYSDDDYKFKGGETVMVTKIDNLKLKITHPDN